MHVHCIEQIVIIIIIIIIVCNKFRFNNIIFIIIIINNNFIALLIFRLLGRRLSRDIKSEHHPEIREWLRLPERSEVRPVWSEHVLHGDFEV